jgi:hypothetical protein
MTIDALTSCHMGFGTSVAARTGLWLRTKDPERRNEFRICMALFHVALRAG